MNSKIFLALAMAGILLAGCSLQPKESNLASKARETYCGLKNNVASVMDCGDRVEVTSSLLGGGISYYTLDSTGSLSGFSCPVVGPDSMSPECKKIYEDNLAGKQPSCTKIC